MPKTAKNWQKWPKTVWRTDQKARFYLNMVWSEMAGSAMKPNGHKNCLGGHYSPKTTQKMVFDPKPPFFQYRTPCFGSSIGFRMSQTTYIHVYGNSKLCIFALGPKNPYFQHIKVGNFIFSKYDTLFWCNEWMLSPTIYLKAKSGTLKFMGLATTAFFRGF